MLFYGLANSPLLVPTYQKVRVLALKIGVLGLEVGVLGWEVGGLDF